MVHPNVSEVPNPSVVLDRWIETTGMNQFRPLAGLPIGYGMHGEVHLGDLDTADLQIHGNGIDILPIGQYDPAIEGWRFPPEYIAASEQEPLAAFYKQHIEADIDGYIERIPPHKRTRADLRDPYTVSVRQDMAKVMQAIPLSTLLERVALQTPIVLSGPVPDSEVITADEATFCYPVLAKGFYPVATINRPEYIPKPSEHLSQLTLCIRGLLAVSKDTPRRTQRTICLLPLGHKTQAEPRRWVPNLDFVTPEEWEALQVLPKMLMDATRNSGGFSPIHASVMRP